MRKPSETADGFAHLEQDPDSWYIRFYLWTYRANPSNINTCKLFWAFLLSVIFAPIRLLIVGLQKIAGLGASKTRPPRPAPVGPSKAEKALEGIEAFFSKIQTPLKYAVFGVVGLYVVFMLIAVIVTFVLHPVYSLAVVGGICIVVGITAAIVIYIDTHNNNVFQRFWDLLVALAKGFHRRTCAKIDLTDQQSGVSGSTQTMERS